MGVKGLKTFLSNNIENFKCIKKIHLKELENKIVAVDFSNLLHRFLVRTESYYLLELLNFVHKFQYYNIKLIFVFDGKPDVDKDYVIKHRRQYREKIFERIDKLKNDQLEETETNQDDDEDNNQDEDNNDIVNLNNFYIDDDANESDNQMDNQNQLRDNKPKLNISSSKKKKDLDHLIKKTLTINHTNIQKSKYLFDILGINYIHIENVEADKIFKYLLDSNIADIVYSGDMDTLLYGCKTVTMDLNYSNDTILYVDYMQMLIDLQISEFEFLHICVLSGTDYNNSLKMSNFRNNIDLIKKYKSIQGVIDNLETINKEQPPDKWKSIPLRFNWQHSCTIFKTYIDNDIITKIKIIIEQQHSIIATIPKCISSYTDNIYNIIKNIKTEYGTIDYKYICKFVEFTRWKYHISIFIKN